MGFLKKLGSVLLKVGAVAAGIGPLAFPNQTTTIGKVVSEIEQLVGLIVTVEAIGQKLNLPGNEKLEAAAPLIADAILRTSFMVDKKVAKPELFTSGAKQIAAGLADVLNSIHEEAVKEESKVV